MDAWGYPGISRQGLKRMVSNPGFEIPGYKNGRDCMKRTLLLTVLFAICFFCLTIAPLHASYVDIGDGTVTDTSTGLMWQQQATHAGTMTWEQALAYCEGLSLGGYTDWRLPAKKELISLVDDSRYNPSINTDYFPGTAASWYWSSTTDVNSTGYAWSVHFDGGYVFHLNKSTAGYVRAVRGGQSGSFANLVISPVSRSVTKDAGATTFSVSNTGTGTMPWSASVISGSWLTITSGASGTDAGTINCNFTTNTSASSRTATIRVTATGATGSPADVTVTQAPTSVQPVLSVTPSNQVVAKDAGTTTFSVSNTGTGTMPWSASVISGSWLTITSGASGTDAGTINCSFTANTSVSSRAATIRVTATGATGSPADVTVTQAPTSTKLTISGSVKTSSGTVISGVLITFNNGGGMATTDGSGNYSVAVPYSYSGAATPSNNGITFIPASRTYSNVTANMTSENYIATPLANPMIGSNSIDGMDVVKITDMSGLLPAGGGAVTARAWDYDGKEIPTAGYASPLLVKNHGTTSIQGADLEARFPDGAPAAYTFLVESSKMFITNYKARLKMRS